MCIGVPAKQAKLRNTTVGTAQKKAVICYRIFAVSILSIHFFIAPTTPKCQACGNSVYAVEDVTVDRGPRQDLYHN